MEAENRRDMEDKEWKKRGVFLGKSLVFLSLLSLMVYGINRTVTPKYRYSSREPTTETFCGFYRMERDTVDVIFLGSSHAATGFNPQDLYDGFGIRSYNLASSSQSLWISYYWLKEALRYQSPQAVVLDCYMLFQDHRKNEPSARKALDDMRWGAVKQEAVKIVCGYDETHSMESYLLPNIRFHTRWTSLEETDFTWGEFGGMPELKGFWLYQQKCGYEEFIPLDLQALGGEPERVPFQEDAKEYLDKIAELCRKNGAELILVKTPTLAETEERHYTIADYAETNGLRFYDFNEKGLFERMGFDYGQDMNDSSATGNRSGHANTSGAKKITYCLGGELRQTLGVEPRSDHQWERTREFNQGVWKDFQLKNETDLRKYLAMLKDSNYIVLIAAKDDAMTSLDGELQKQLRDLGLQADWSDGFRKSYYAILEGNQVKAEKMSGEKLERMGSFRNGRVLYKIVSAGLECGNDCSIQINGGEQAKKKRGLNIVVYSLDRKCVVDSVVFDTYAPELTASR